MCYSLADSNSLDGESGFEEAEVSEVASGVTKVITRFIEKVGKFVKTQINICILYSIYSILVTGGIKWRYNAKHSLVKTHFISLTIFILSHMLDQV